MTKRAIAFHDLPTPPFQVFERPDEPLDLRLVFPLFAKPGEGEVIRTWLWRS
jgi:D-alanine-D-alanine ligase